MRVFLYLALQVLRLYFAEAFGLIKGDIFGLRYMEIVYCGILLLLCSLLCGILLLLYSLLWYTIVTVQFTVVYYCYCIVYYGILLLLYSILDYCYALQ